MRFSNKVGPKNLKKNQLEQNKKLFYKKLSMNIVNNIRNSSEGNDTQKEGMTTKTLKKTSVQNTLLETHFSFEKDILFCKHRYYIKT